MKQFTEQDKIFIEYLPLGLIIFAAIVCIGILFMCWLNNQDKKEIDLDEEVKKIYNEGCKKYKKNLKKIIVIE
jgi:FtsZ-interacting cell division protein ZipA